MVGRAKWKLSYSMGNNAWLMSMEFTKFISLSQLALSFMEWCNELCNTHFSANA